MFSFPDNAKRAASSMTSRHHLRRPFVRFALSRPLSLVVRVLYTLAEYRRSCHCNLMWIAQRKLDHGDSQPSGRRSALQFHDRAANGALQPQPRSHAGHGPRQPMNQSMTRRLPALRDFSSAYAGIWQCAAEPVRGGFFLPSRLSRVRVSSPAPPIHANRQTVLTRVWSPCAVLCPGGSIVIGSSKLGGRFGISL